MNALETVLDALAHFRAMDEDLFLITHLAMSRRMIFFSQVIEGISPSLAVSPGLPLADNGRVGAGNKLREVIAGLLDETTSENALIRGMLVERMTGLDAVTHIVRARSSVAEFLEIFGKSETRWGPAESRLFSPAIVLDGIVMMRAASTFVAAAGESSYPAANLKLRSGISRSAYLSAWYKDAHPLSTHVFYLGSGVFTKHFHAIAMRRMAATRLAIRLFEIEHDRFPLSLDELVLAYLTTVPRDPFAPVDRSISYLPNNKPPLLYSIGPNGIDDGGRWQPERDRIDDTNLDLPFFLSGEDARGKGPADLP